MFHKAKLVRFLVALCLASWASVACTSRSSACFPDGIKRSRESVLRQNLFTLRSLIQQYTLDKQKAPQSLNDLVAAGYLKQIPKDPMTGAADWMVERGEDTVGSPDQQVGGISHVHSAASATSCEGPRYSSW